ncbi:MAG: YerC/YecD family TrpR-related protein [Patescibacteria group bacterium]|nr:YerC/YecD family TrpR-related protein [Patescibacteria group bacterium]
MSESKDKKNKWINQDSDALFGVVLKLENLDESRRFFRDLLTEKEIVELGQRWKVARMLAKGVSYVKIEEETAMSSATIARIHKWLKHGMGGYKLVLKRLKNNI